MCGIAGVWRQDNTPVEEQTLANMVRALRYRGPDASGLKISRSIGLAHQRLSIIDLSPAGHQPMTTPDGRYTILCNSEIYNYRALRDKFCPNIPLNSSSDTEILLYVLSQQGAAALPAIKGMFALALWDELTQQLLLARDPFGKKPLYYFHTGAILLFASELKAITQHPACVTRVDRASVVKYLLYEYVPAPHTGLAGVKQLPPGSYAIINRQLEMKIKSWWQPVFTPKHKLHDREALAQFDSLLNQSVKRRLVADVPVGVLLSGGLDSTTIAWYMKKQLGNSAIRSYSIGFGKNFFDESGYAQQAAHVIGCDHTSQQFTLSDFKHYLTQLPAKLDIPLGDSSLLPTWQVCDLARRDVKVVLDGDGSDELLGGYGTFTAAAVAEKLPRLSRAVWSIINQAAQHIPTRYEYFTFDFKLKSFLRGLGYPLPRRHQIWLGSFNEAELAALLTADYVHYQQDLWTRINTLSPALSDLHWFDQVSALTIRDYLQNDILVKLDRAAMFASLEARTPFLDVDLAEFIMRLPVELKKDKYILRQLMRGRVPDTIIDRKKQGFALPLGHWLRQELYHWAKTILSSNSRDPIYKRDKALLLLEEHRQGRKDNRKKLWTLLMLKLWQDHWLN